jgi:hypothetical protein
MRRLHAVALAVWDFVVGDDPWTALGVTIALGLTAAVAGAGVAAWWIVPVGVCGLLVASLRRATR